MKAQVWDGKKMRQVMAIDWNDDGEIISCHTKDEKLYPNPEIHPEIVIRWCTGLKDRKGKEIYGGDYIKYKGILYHIQWSQYLAGFQMYPDWSQYDDDLNEDDIEEYARVIGNEFQNPEIGYT